MKNSMLVIFFAAMLTLAFSSETGTFAFDVPSADAKSDSKSKDKKSKDSKSKDSKSKDSKSKDSKSKDSKSKDSKSKDSKSKDSKSKDSKSKDSKSKDKEKKETICHYPPGNPENMQTLSVGESAVPAHLAHGDTMGECVESEDEGAGGAPSCVCPPGVSSCVCADGTPGSSGGASSSSTPASSHREVMGQ